MAGIAQPPTSATSTAAPEIAISALAAIRDMDQETGSIALAVGTAVDALAALGCLTTAPGQIVPSSPPSAESDPAFRALVEAYGASEWIQAFAQGEARFRAAVATKRDALSAVLAAHAKVVAALSRAREALRDARAALDRDRTGLAAALAVILDEVKGRRWMRADGDGDEGGTWGSYGYREQTVATLRREVGWAFDAISRHATAALRASGDLATAECRKADDILRALASGGDKP